MLYVCKYFTIIYLCYIYLYTTDFFNRDTMLLGNLPFSCKTLAFLVSGNSPSK